MPTFARLLLFLWMMSVASAAETAPDFLWAQKAGGTDQDTGYAIAVDGGGNVYVTGFFTGTISFGTTNLGSSGLEDIFVVKYDATGNLIWAQKAGGTGYDEGRAIVVDGTSNIYVTGLFQGSAAFSGTNLSSSGQSDIFLAKYDSAGNLLWARKAGGKDFDEGHGIALDKAGNIYLTGYFDGTATFGAVSLSGATTFDNIFIAKSDPAGNFVWASKAEGTDDAEGNAIAVDGATNVFVTGSFIGTVSFGATNLSSAGARDMFLAKYSNSGNLFWVAQAGGTNDDKGDAICVNPAGQVYATGQFVGIAGFGSTNVAGNSADIFIAAYDTTGNVLWVRKAGGNNAIYGDSGFGIRADAMGNLFVAGYFSGTANFGAINLSTSGFDDLFLVKYSSAGNVLWAQKAGGNNLDVAYGIALDDSGTAYLTGFFSSAATFGMTTLTNSGSWDVFVAKVGSLSPVGLSALKSGTNISLSWPASAQGFALESNEVLVPTNWTSVTAATNIIGSSNVVTLPMSGQRLFFRLHKH